ncbi:MAG: cupin domain-containing protein [Gaiellales bacterium]
MAQTTTVIAEHVGGARLDSWPLPPEQVVDGDPRASGKIIWKSSDGTLANGIWECTPGIFNYQHADETAFVLAGRATITPEGEAPIEVGAGDVVFFPGGTKTRWHIEETIRKSFHLHAAEGLGL